MERCILTEPSMLVVSYLQETTDGYTSMTNIMQNYFSGHQLVLKKVYSCTNISHNYACAFVPYLPVTPAQLVRPGIAQNVCCAVGDFLHNIYAYILREMWFVDC